MARLGNIALADGILPDSISLDAFKQKIKDLYQAGIDFQAVFTKLQSLEQTAMQDAGSYAKWQDLMTRGTGLQTTISNAMDSLQSAYQWIKNNLGVDLQQTGLGFLPVLIPIAVVGAVVAALIAAKAWINDASNEAKRLEIIAAMRPEQQVQALQTMPAPTALGNISSIVMWGAIGIFAFMVAPKLIDAFKR